jgi:hypothetical protein
MIHIIQCGSTDIIRGWCRSCEIFKSVGKCSLYSYSIYSVDSCHENSKLGSTPRVSWTPQGSERSSLSFHPDRPFALHPVEQQPSVPTRGGMRVGSCTPRPTSDSWSPLRPRPPLPPPPSSFLLLLMSSTISLSSLPPLRRPPRPPRPSPSLTWSRVRGAAVRTATSSWEESSPKVAVGRAEKKAEKDARAAASTSRPAKKTNCRRRGGGRDGTNIVACSSPFSSDT